MFSSLDDKELEIVIDAMELKEFGPGDKVIQQGDDGDELYVVESGTLSCYRVMAKGEEPTFLKKYEQSDAFGELALLYNAPRAATIVSDSVATLYSLDRATFNAIVKDSAAKKREKYEEFLKSVPLLSNMEDYERQKIADAVRERKFADGEFVIREGELGNVFYLLSEGEAIATKTLEAGKRSHNTINTRQGSRRDHEIQEGRLLRRASTSQERAASSQRDRKRRSSGGFVGAQHVQANARPAGGNPQAEHGTLQSVRFLNFLNWSNKFLSRVATPR